jgi:hypothetical protein
MLNMSTREDPTDFDITFESDMDNLLHIVFYFTLLIVGAEVARGRSPFDSFASVLECFDWGSLRLGWAERLESERVGIGQVHWPLFG